MPANAYINPAAQTAQANYIRTNGTHVTLCSGVPADYSGISGVALAAAEAVSIGAPSTSGSKPTEEVTINVPAVSDKTVTAQGTASYLAFHNNSDTLVAISKISNEQQVEVNNKYTINTFDITIPGANQS